MFSLNASNLGLASRNNTVKDWVISNVWLDETRGFVIEVFGDFPSVHEVTGDCVIDLDNNFGVGSYTDSNILSMYASPQLQVK